MFSFREDGYFNMTKAAQSFGKRLDNFKALPSTQEYMEALASSLNISEEELMISTQGSHRGTFAHPKLAVFFARCLDVKFAVWCDSMIEDILKGAAKVDIVKPQQSAVIRTTEALGTCSQSLTSTSSRVSAQTPPPFAW